MNEARQLVGLLCEDVVPTLSAGAQMLLRRKKGLEPHEPKKDERDSRSLVDHLITDLDMPVDVISVLPKSDPKALQAEKGTKPPVIPEPGTSALDTVLGKNPTPVQPATPPSPPTPPEKVASEMTTSTEESRRVLGHTGNYRPQPEPASSQVPVEKSRQIIEQTLALMGVSAPGGSQEGDPLVESLQTAQKLEEVVSSAVEPGIPMPMHKPGNGTQIFNTFHRFAVPLM